MSSTKDENLYRKVVESNPSLITLSVEQPPETHRDDRSDEDYDTDGDHGRDDEFQRETLRHKFDSVLEGLLHCCHQSLRSLSIEIEYPLSWLSFRPLVNLSNLRMVCIRRTKVFWDVISSIEFTVMMPALEHVEIALYKRTKEWPICSSRNDAGRG